MGRMKYLLDTNICVYYLKGQFNMDSKIAKAGLMNCYISEITILELLYGAINSDSKRKTENLEKVVKFDSIFAERIVPVRDCFHEFALQKTRLRQLGTPVSDFDLLIGCSAIASGCILVSRNVKEMKRISGVEIENWAEVKTD